LAGTKSGPSDDAADAPSNLASSPQGDLTFAQVRILFRSIAVTTTTPMTVERPRAARPSIWTSIARLVWALTGFLTAALAVAWVLWINAHPLLGSAGPNTLLTCRTSLPAYASALVAWASFARAFRRKAGDGSTSEQPSHPKES
jgi:hypothetical protein